MKKQVNRRLLAIIVISCLIAISSLGFNKVAGSSYSATLDYGEYFYTSSNKLIGIEGFVDWSFIGSNSFVGIDVWIMRDFEFSAFHTFDLSFEGYLVSDGSYYDDYGSFDFPKEDIWYIVFLHDDLTAMLQTTTLDIRVDFDYGYFGLGILLLIIFLPIVLVAGIITLIVVLVIRKKRKPIQQ